MKRLFDLFFSSMGLLVLWPLFLVIAILIKQDSSGPVFFQQKRVGRGFKVFNLYKFRTMAADAPSKGLTVTAGGDSRITPIGAFLRKTKIDELPELINVLKGDMSLVGPRPEVPKYVEMFKGEYKEILKLKPGITDYAAIEFRDEEGILKRYDNPEEGYVKEVLPRKIELYKKYLQERNFLIDIRLIFLTLYRIMR
jgi:lipopolysaccharide/colanic/teichoic acid biosynthesis glycosyltransferase